MGVVALTASATRREQHLESLLAMFSAWTQSSDTRTLLEQMAADATRAFDADRASIFVWDRANKLLIGRPALGLPNNELQLPDDVGVVGRVVRTGKPERVVVAETPEAVERSVDAQSGYVTQTLLCVPLVDSQGDVHGAFELINKRGGEFTADDEEGLGEMARLAAIALDGTTHYEELLRRRDALVDAAAQRVRLLGECPAIVALRSAVTRVADTDLAVLVLGENGTGKEVVAQTIHYGSRRREEPLIAVNCAALTETLLESELFGHERGAFTDAREMRPGKFELAAKGTLFLDEIGDMSLGGQAKLLRVLEEKVVVRVGGSQEIHTDARIIAATNQNLAQRVRERKFREDLYYRLNVVSLELPPLRERGEDVLLLADQFLTNFCKQMGRKKPKLSPEARKRLVSHRWPGNVRELRNLIERLAYLSSSDRIEAEEIAFNLSPFDSSEAGLEVGLSLAAATDEFQRDYIRRTIKSQHGSVTDAAKQLEVHRSNLYRKMKQLGMEGEE